ncbi:hypothetical protein AYI69_g6854 [Smittium culicis]|uniref:Uncharacterized protein n=1 Tax=Smittium culicis TaxID=133412 RepID=A0A1R1XW57_9FUNG|nr:hypothetical protein AYI69_g6854 [Smittium culicis]
MESLIFTVGIWATIKALEYNLTAANRLVMLERQIGAKLHKRTEWGKDLLLAEWGKDLLAEWGKDIFRVDSRR